MEHAAEHLNANWRIYMALFSLGSFAALYWLTKYFATRKELEQHRVDFSNHLMRFQEHEQDHRRLRDLVHEIKSDLKNLPTAKESAKLRETMAQLSGRLEGLDPILKTLLNNDNMLLESGLRKGEKD